MNRHKKLEEYRDQIRQCVKCGTCRAHCPVFSEENREATVARGKVALAEALLDGELGPDGKLGESISKCLLCGKCVQNCPNQVPVDDIMLAARREIAKRKGLSLFGRGISTVLKRPLLMKLLARAGALFSPLLFKKIQRQSGLRLRFPAPFITRDRSLPEFTGKPFRDRHPEFLAGAPDRPLVTFFTGCMINHIYPEIGESALQALRHLGMNVLIPKDQGCCGLPALCSGDGATAEKLALRNLSALTHHQPDHIVTACASCLSGLTKYMREHGGEFEQLAEKVIDINVFLVHQGLPDALQSLPVPLQTRRVTFHTPCHLRNHGILAEPRALLQAVPGIELVEMTEADSCCGLGGTFSVYHYETSKKIGSRKAEAIRNSGAELVATACPGCIMQLQDTLNHAGLQQRAVHVLELVGRAISGDNA
ncbi:MAG: (Fe-S)-binding protein [Syntrophotaleaceae bacterium]